MLVAFVLIIGSYRTSGPFVLGLFIVYVMFVRPRVYA